MTSKVQIVVNGPSYVGKFTKKNKDGQVVATGEVRGHPGNAQGFLEIYVAQDETIEVTEVYEPVPVEAEPA